MLYLQIPRTVKVYAIYRFSYIQLYCESGDTFFRHSRSVIDCTVFIARSSVSKSALPWKPTIRHSPRVTASCICDLDRACIPTSPAGTIYENFKGCIALPKKNVFSPHPVPFVAMRTFGLTWPPCMIPESVVVYCTQVVHVVWSCSKSVVWTLLRGDP